MSKIEQYQNYTIKDVSYEKKYRVFYNSKKPKISGEAADTVKWAEVTRRFNNFQITFSHTPELECTDSFIAGVKEIANNLEDIMRQCEIAENDYFVPKSV